MILKLYILLIISFTVMIKWAVIIIIVDIVDSVDVGVRFVRDDFTLQECFRFEIPIKIWVRWHEPGAVFWNRD